MLCATDVVNQSLAPSAVTIALIGYLESISMAKAFGRKNGYDVSASQELVALGALNVVGSFFKSMPVTGSFSRTAVSSACRVRTQLSSVLAALVVVLACEVFTTTFAYIPKATLAALVIVAVLSLVEITVSCCEEIIFELITNHLVDAAGHLARVSH